MNKVFLGSPKIFAKRKIYTPSMLIEASAPHVVKVFQTQEEADLAKMDMKHGTYVIDKRLYVYSEFYSSIFMFNEDELTEYMQNNSGSIEGFSNTNPDVMANWFVADFDHKDGIKGIIHQISKALMYFNLHKIPYYLFASGKKGLHLYIPIQVFNFPEEYRNKMHIVFSSIADWMEHEFGWENGFIDRLYDPVRMFRFPFTLHPDTGLIKTFAIFKADKYNPAAEISSYLSIERGIDTDIAKLWRRPLLIPYEGKITKTIDITITEKQVYENSPADITNKTFLTPKIERMCVYSMLNATNIEGQRHKIALVLLFWLKEKGYPEDLAFKFMEYWSSKLIKPLTHDELVDIMKYYGRYTLSCSHEDMKRYCPMNSTCSYWKNEVLSQRVYDLAASLEATIGLANETLATRFYFNEVMPGMKGFTSSKYGHIGGIMAASEVGKTWILLNIIAKIKRMNFLFFSYEQSRYELLLRLATLHDLDINDPGECQILLDAMSNVYIDDSGATTIDEQMDVVRAVEAEHGIKIHFILIDYIQLVSVEDKNFPGKYVTNNTQSMVEVSKRIKKLAKDNEIGYIFLSQVPKEVSGNGNTMLSAEDFKDSQALQAMCDWIFALWRPNKDVMNKTDNILSVSLAKHKHIPNSHQLSHYYFENGKIGQEAVELVDVRQRRI